MIAIVVLMLVVLLLLIFLPGMLRRLAVRIQDQHQARLESSAAYREFDRITARLFMPAMIAILTVSVVIEVMQ